MSGPEFYKDWGFISAEEQRSYGAGYGNRTRLAGLGSQNITTMLSPHAVTDVGPASAVSEVEPEGKHTR